MTATLAAVLFVPTGATVGAVNNDRLKLAVMAVFEKTGRVSVAKLPFCPQLSTGKLG